MIIKKLNIIGLFLCKGGDAVLFAGACELNRIIINHELLWGLFIREMIGKKSATSTDEIVF